MLPKDLHICYGCMNEKEGDGPCKYCGFTEEDAQHLPWEYGQLPFGHVLAGRYLDTLITDEATAEALLSQG